MAAILMVHNLIQKRAQLKGNFKLLALTLQPLYKQQAMQSKTHKLAMAAPQNGYSSPVCYAHLHGMREGFEN